MLGPLSLLALGACVANVAASPWKLIGRNKREASAEAGSDAAPPAYGHSGSWGPSSEPSTTAYTTQTPSSYGGSWGPSTSIWSTPTVTSSVPTETVTWTAPGYSFTYTETTWQTTSTCSPVPPVTVYVTKNWNVTSTEEQFSTSTATEVDYSTTTIEETTTAPGKSQVNICFESLSLFGVTVCAPPNV